MKIFVLEDNKWRNQAFRNWFEKDSLIITETVDEAIDLLNIDKKWDIMFLDHDLGNQIYTDITEYNTGSTLAKWLYENPVDCKIIIHSMNVYGAQNMMSYLPQAEYIPFISLTDRIKEIK